MKRMCTCLGNWENKHMGERMWWLTGSAWCCHWSTDITIKVYKTGWSDSDGKLSDVRAFLNFWVITSFSIPVIWYKDRQEMCQYNRSWDAMLLLLRSQGLSNTRNQKDPSAGTETGIKEKALMGLMTSCIDIYIRLLHFNHQIFNT